jgi:hypothetical protein
MGQCSTPATPTTSNELVLIWAAEGGAEREEAVGVPGRKRAQWWGAGRVNGGEKGGGRCPESNGVVPSDIGCRGRCRAGGSGRGGKSARWWGAGQVNGGEKGGDSVQNVQQEI